MKSYKKNNLNHLGNQLKFYLYGHDSINYVNNKDILISTLKYIKETRRFSTYRLSTLESFGCGWVGVRQPFYFCHFFSICMRVLYSLSFYLFFDVSCCNFLGLAMDLAKFCCQAMCNFRSRRKILKEKEKKSSYELPCPLCTK